MKIYNRARYGSYLVNMTMAAVTNITPVLMIPLKDLYGISYTQLGLLVLVNFGIQLGMDVFFSFFSHRFSIPKVIRTIPWIGVTGFLLFAAAPLLFPAAVYAGIALGTVVMASASGLSEVLISPLIAAIPSENPDHEMSRLHALYAWGVVLVVAVSTLFLLVFGRETWQWLLVMWALLPLTAGLLYAGAKMPEMPSGARGQKVSTLLLNPAFLLCFFCIFLGGASECTMAQWSSGFLERAMQLPKTVGDLVGVAMFGVMLGLGRSVYAKVGKNLYRTLFLGSCMAVVCYLVVTLSGVPIVSAIACAATGLAVAMLWPGTLIAATEAFPQGGVMMFALLAAAGDLGAAFGPWAVGNVTDALLTSSQLSEQAALQGGLLTATAFPIAAVVCFGLLWKWRKKPAVA